MSPHTPAVEPRIIPSLLQQLRDDYAAAASRLRSLEEAIQNVDCQLIKRHLAHTGDQSPVNTYSEPPGLNIKNNNTKKPPRLPRLPKEKPPSSWSCRQCNSSRLHKQVSTRRRSLGPKSKQIPTRKFRYFRM
ncbi:hypothetical protein BDFG_04464 [Blastomyces dermatitidis ATCC 26199]|nr:hypothetical protein BDFG_04464 [Blastomyces dermatitidis ATCC 26199]